MKDGYFVMRAEDGARLLRKALSDDSTLRKQLLEILGVE